MITQRIPVAQIFKIEFTPRAELQKKISENLHKTIIIQHQHDNKVETTKGTLIGYSRIHYNDHEVQIHTEEKLVPIQLSSILHLDFEDENLHIVHFLDSGEISSTTSEEEPPKQITLPKPKPTRLSEQTISKTLTSPKAATDNKAKRTQQGWNVPSPTTETYADKVKRPKKPKTTGCEIQPDTARFHHQTPKRATEEN